MKRSMYFVFITILLLTNVFNFIFLKKEKEVYYYYVVMKGNSKHWKVENFTIEIMPQRTEFGHGSLYYLGNNKDVKQLYLDFFLGDQKVFKTAYTGDWLLHSPLKLGSISNKTDNYSKKITLDEINNAYLIIRWQTKEGTFHIENIELF